MIVETIPSNPKEWEEFMLKEDKPFIKWNCPPKTEGKKLRQFYKDRNRSKKLKAQYGLERHVYLKMLNYDHAAVSLLEEIMRWFLVADYIHIKEEALKNLGIPKSTLTRKFKMIFDLPFITREVFPYNNERAMSFNYEKFLECFYENRVPYNSK